MNETPSSTTSLQSASLLSPPTRGRIERHDTLLPANDDEKDDDGDYESATFRQKRAAPSSAGSQGNDQAFASRRKRRKLNVSSNATKNEYVAAGERSVIDLTSPPPANRYQSNERRNSIPIKTQEGQAVISLLDSSDDEDDYDTKPSATTTEQPLDPQAAMSISEETMTSNQLQVEKSRTGRAIIEMIDDTNVLPFATRTLSLQITPQLAATAAVLPPPINEDHERQFQDFVEGDLSHQNKEENYVNARRPEQRLKKELDHLYDQLRAIGTHNTNDRRHDVSTADHEARTICRAEIIRVKKQLKTAQQNAAQDIFNRNNSAGGMGNMDANNGNLSIDFHGLYVKEAIVKFGEIVLPILPVQREVVIITGKGNHSRNRKSKLQDGLIAHIRQTDEFKREKMEYNVNPSNSGQLIVRSLQY
jgi:hypothetical protein